MDIKRDAYLIGQALAQWQRGLNFMEVHRYALSLKLEPEEDQVLQQQRFIQGYHSISPIENFEEENKERKFHKMAEQEKKQTKLDALRNKQPQNDKPTHTEENGRVNTLSLSGYLVKDPELKTSKNGKEMLLTGISYNKVYVTVIMMIEDAEPDEVEIAAGHTKGDNVVIEGRLSLSEYQDKVQVTIFATSIM